MVNNIYEVTVVRKLKKLVDISVGYQPKRRGGIRADPESDWRIIQISDFDDDLSLDFDHLTTFEPDRDPEPYQVRQGDVLFLARGHKNWAVALDHNMDRTVVVAYFFILRIVERDLTPSYLAWYLNQAPAQEFLSRVARRGSHMPVITKGALLDLPVQLPSVRKQSQVVQLDRLAQKERQIACNLGEKRDELIRVISLKTISSE